MANMPALKLPLRSNPSARDLAVFFRSLATMFEAGLPLLRGLEQLAEQSENATLRRAARHMAGALSQGKYLSRAMHESGCFTDLQQRLVSSGELSGRLGLILSRLATYEEERSVLLHKVQSALVTPLCVSGFCLLMVIVLPPLCLQGLLQMLRDTGMVLPWPTVLLMRFSALLLNGWFYFGLVLVGATGAGLLFRFGDMPEVQLRLYRVLLAIPVLGPMVRVLAVVRFSQTLASLMESGINLLAAVRVSAEGSGNPVLDEAIEETEKALREGATLAAALAASGFFPETFLQALVAGEESGSPQKLLRDMTRIYQMELESRIAGFVAVLEPMLMAFVGAVVAFTCLAAILPMLRIVDGL